MKNKCLCVVQQQTTESAFVPCHVFPTNELLFRCSAFSFTFPCHLEKRLEIMFYNTYVNVTDIH